MARGRKPKENNGNGNGANLGFEAKLWAAADKLRNNMDAAEYKHVVLGLIFLKYISDAFEERRGFLEREAQDPKSDWFVKDTEGRYETLEDRDAYQAESIFWVPKEARWTFLQGSAKQPTIGKLLDDAMVAIERENPRLKGVLPKDYARPALDKQRLGELIDLIGTIGLGDAENRSKDVLGRVYEYFLARFASAEGKGGGQFYTPRCVVRVLVEMLAPYRGRVLDPCCGSGGMFVQSEKFVEAHGGTKGDISIFGQESNQTTWRLAVMNLAIRGIEAHIAWNVEGSFHNDAQKDLKADFVLANPPFNDSDWGGERLREDVRWKFGAPPPGNANFAWVQHFIHHLCPTGTAGFVLANGSMSSAQSGEGEIRKAIVEADLVDCMVALPGQLFYSTQIPVCLWFVTRDKAGGRGGSYAPRLRDRRGEVLFIDARKLGTMVDRVHRELTEDDIQKIARTYHAWRGDSPEPSPTRRIEYQDVPGFCKAAKLEEIRGHGHVLTPGRYVGAEAQEDDLPAPRPGVFFVYAIACEGGSYYIGQTEDLPRRWRDHMAGSAAEWTKAHKPRYIAHYEELPSREEAVVREQELKSTAGRRWLKQTIAEGRARQAGGEPFDEKMKRLTAQLEEQFAEGAKLDEAIRENLRRLGFGR